jgi:capsule polysaccharide export protein KpsE/RkpR
VSRATNKEAEKQISKLNNALEKKEAEIAALKSTMDKDTVRKKEAEIAALKSTMDNTVRAEVATVTEKMEVCILYCRENLCSSSISC